MACSCRKSIPLLLLLLVLQLAAARKIDEEPPTVEQQISENDDAPTVEREFKGFVQRHGKAYNNPLEQLKAKMVFQHNRKLVRDHNKKANKKFKVGLNKFADRPIEELKKQLLGAKPPVAGSVPRLKGAPEPRVGMDIHGKHDGNRRKRQSVPDYANYTEWGYTTDIENQGQCGSCWSFSAAATLSAHFSFYTGEVAQLSEQNLIDCSGSYGNYGCNGGWPGSAMKYVKDNGIMRLENYAYTGKDGGQCQYDPNMNIASYACVGGVNYLPEGDEDAMKTTVYNIGPLAVAIDASDPNFMYYTGGIYWSNTCTKNVNHAVVITGYGTEDGQDFWIVRNSWGADWGEQGYVRFARGNNNQCAIASWAHYPDLVQCGT